MTDKKTFVKEDMQKLRIRLLLEQPFWGALALNLTVVEDGSIPTAATDGNALYYNPAFMASMNLQEQTGVLAHEVTHCALLHMFRRDGRDMGRWNIACDLALNPLLIEAGFKLPDGVLIDPKYKGMSAEEIYSKLTPQIMQGIKGLSKGDMDPNCPTGTFSDGAQHSDNDQDGKGGTGSDEDDGKGKQTGSGDGRGKAAPKLTEQDWQIAAEQAAAVAKSAGTVPGALLEQITATHDARIDWRAQLAQFVTQTMVTDVAWTRPNRRYVGRGMYLPGAMKENVGEIVVSVDTSGSISTQMLHDFAAELTGILHTARPDKMHVVYADASVNAVEVFTPDDPEIILNAKGRGGTAFCPTFDWVEQQAIDPLCLIYLTDLDSCDTPTEPGYPVLWVTPEFTKKEGPFGQTIAIPAKD